MGLFVFRPAKRTNIWFVISAKTSKEAWKKLASQVSEVKWTEWIDRQEATHEKVLDPNPGRKNVEVEKVRILTNEEIRTEYRLHEEVEPSTISGFRAKGKIIVIS